MSTPSEDDLRALARRLAEEARHAGPAVEHVRRFGDARLRLCVTGRALADLLEALGGRPTQAPPDGCIRLWERPPGAPPVPWREHDLGPRGLVRRPGAPGETHAAVNEPHALTLVDVPAREVLWRSEAAAELPWWERAAPLRPALFWALAGPGRGLVHAGAVGDERGAVLLAGPGGSGKTTVALAAAADGMRYVADDYLLIEAGPPARAVNLFTTAKLDAGHLARFPALARRARRSADPVDGEKYVLPMPQDALATELVVRAVAVPQIAGPRTAVRSISGAAALLALAPSTAMQMPYDGGAVLATLASVVRGLPCFALEVGEDPADLAPAVDEMLERTAVPV
ncbi:MAG TPA: hypothetical protein VHX88_10460 [Solirubrobacteraceae bacterium]|jgi:hypothetical protein|nr:hypothetical protein [Solirubrobacteraceae bacterium]